jgi:hypothetical protein
MPLAPPQGRDNAFEQLGSGHDERLKAVHKISACLTRVVQTVCGDQGHDAIDPRGDESVACALCR